MTLPSISRGPRGNRRAGTAAYMVLFVLLPLAGLLTAFLTVGLRYTNESSGRRDDERALHLAEAGLEESLFALRAGGSGAIASEAAPAYLGNGLLWVETQDVANDLMLVKSMAMCGRGRVALERLLFHYESPPLYSSVLFSNQSFDLDSNVMVDSFDSSLGNYAAQLAASGGSYVGTGAVIQSNGDVVVESAVEIWGDIHPGEDSVVDQASSSDVSGSLQPLAEERILDPVVVPPAPLLGPLTVPGTNVVLAPGTYGFTDVSITTGGHLTITGPATIVLDTYDQESNTDLVIDPAGGPVEIYVTGDFVTASNSTITTTTSSALDSSLWFAGGPGQVVDLRSNAEFYGTIYAPETTVDVASNFEVFGAIAADYLELSSNVQIHFDEALLGHSPGGKQFITSAWSYSNFPRADLMSQRTDPFRLLGVDKGLLPSPGDAHAP